MPLKYQSIFDAPLSNNWTQHHSACKGELYHSTKEQADGQTGEQMDRQAEEIRMGAFKICHKLKYNFLLH